MLREIMAKAKILIAFGDFKMATTSMLTTNSLTVKLWAVEGFTEMMKSTCFGRMVARGTLGRVLELDNAKAGDDITFNYTGKLSGVGIQEGGTLDGNEEALDLQSDSMKLGIVRHGVASPNDDTIEQHRTHVNFQKQATFLLPQWHASRVDASVFNQLAGVNSTTITVDGTVYSGTDRPIVQGLNDVTDPTTNRILRAGGAATDQALTSADTLTLDLIDAAVELAGRTYPNIATLEGEEFDLYISYEQYTDLKRDTTGKIQWYTNVLADAQAGNNSALTEASIF